MSEVRALTSVRRLKNGKEVTVKMECNVGDPYQDYQGDDGKGGALVAPDWMVDKNRPIIWAEIYSNLQRIVYTDDKWTYNVTELTFDPQGLSNNVGLEGVFQKITHNGVPALKIMKNLASKENQDNDLIQLDCAFRVAGIDDRAQGYMTVQIGRASADVYKGTIYAVEGTGCTISNDKKSIKVKGELKHGGSVVQDSLYKVEWRKIVDGALQPLLSDSGATVADSVDHTITITQNMVDTVLNLYAIFKDLNGKVLTQDVQGIMDASDPLRIAINAVPANLAIVNDSDTVVFTPNVVDKDGNVKTEFANKFKFLLSKNDGTPITADDDHSKVAAASQTITANDVDKAEPGDLNIEIIANDTF